MLPAIQVQDEAQQQEYRSTEIKYVHHDGLGSLEINHLTLKDAEILRRGQRLCREENPIALSVTEPLLTAQRRTVLYVVGGIGGSEWKARKKRVRVCLSCP
jgi:hypothetical protein